MNEMSYVTGSWCQCFFLFCCDVNVKSKCLLSEMLVLCGGSASLLFLSEYLANLHLIGNITICQDKRFSNPPSCSVSVSLHFDSAQSWILS